MKQVIDVKRTIKNRAILLISSLILWFCLFFIHSLTYSQENQAKPNDIWLLTINGAIGPAVADYVVRGIEKANENDAQLIVLQMDTPGGLDLSMRSMIKAILASPVPVASYVAPEGARAASAGTYILYASHIAAMAPATNLGAATPVQIGGGGLPDSSDEQKENEKPPGSGSSMEKKIINDAVAYIRGLAELRGRNQQWAEEAVRTAASLTASAALKKNVIDVIAQDIDELLELVDGKKITINEKQITVATKGKSIYTVEPDWRNELLTVITDPSIAYILLLVGVYGLLLEFYNPGFGLPGIVGAISLLLSAYALQLLPINYAGLGLLFLGIALIVAEAFLPSFGVLGIGGIIAFVIGSVMLMDTDIPEFQIATPIIISIAVFSLFIFFFVLYAIVKIRKRNVVSGASSMVGGVAEAFEDFSVQGKVYFQGELWQAKTNMPLQKGDKVKVAEVNGLTLNVKKEQ